MTNRFHTHWRIAAPLLLLLTLSNLLGCEGEEPPPTGVFVTVTSTTTLDSLLVKVRNLNYDTVVQSIDLGGRNLLSDSYVVALEPTSQIDGAFLLYVQGLRGEERVAGASLTADFAEASLIELELRLTEGFQDDDGDGFEPCLSGPSCDCADSLAAVNPFTVELCETPYDDNCSGFANEGCACTEDADCTVLPDELRHLAGIGACTLGTLACEGGVLSQECVGAGTSSAEVVGNGIDDDCDGHVDEGGSCPEVGTSRPCFLGLIDMQAEERAVGSCAVGQQFCEEGGLWGDCTNEVRPSFEQPPLDWHEQGEQCDGEDNDCDGLIDDEPIFDADQDGYTACGTCELSVGGIERTCDECGRDAIGDDQPKLCAAFIDCADEDPGVYPFNQELCGNSIDEDCRCDHDAEGSESILGLPIVELDGSSNCVPEDQYLNCERELRTDSNPAGTCSESSAQSGPYYYGYRIADSDNCYYCGDRFGESCVPDGTACSTKGADCSTCEGWDEQVQPIARPSCTEPSDIGCTGQDDPSWDLVIAGDPYADCAAVSCGGYYWGISNDDCFERSDQASAEVDCMEADEGSRCEGSEELCPLEATAKANPVFRELCTKATSGCTETTPPFFSYQENNEDIFSECSASYTCVASLADGGGPFYWGIADDSDDGQSNGECYLRANVGSSGCNGSGLCQGRVEACSSSPRGDPETGRPVCQRPADGCSGTSAPGFSNVDAYSDPYVECGQEGCCVSGGGQGMCCQVQGQSCGTTSECAFGLSCVDGVCCDGLCNSPCQSCLASNNISGLDGLCSDIAVVQEDVSPVALCGDSSGGCGGDTGCMCEAGTGNCKRAKGSTCLSNTNCASGECECADSSCSTKRCSEVDCDPCKYNSDGNQSCEGNVSDNVDDADDSCGTLTCNGLAGCNQSNGGGCTVNQECLSNICILGTCGPPANSGESCDENADCLSPNVCNGDQVCRIPGIDVVNNPGGILTTEAGDTDTFQLVLTSRPDASVTIGITSTDSSEATVSPPSLTFTTGNWSTPKTVEVTGVNDSAADGPISYTITTAAAVSADPNYNGFDGPDVAGTNADNDVAGVTVSPTVGLVTTEAGAQATFSVVLNTLPTHRVTMTLESSDGSEVTVSPESLEFLASTWSTPQTVTVTGVDDWVDDGDATLSVSVEAAVSSDPNYDSLDPEDVAVTNEDNDESGISISPTSGLTTSEAGGTAQFTLVLTSKPSGAVSVGITSSDTGEGTVSESSVTFSASGWSTPKTITVTGADDTIDDGNQSYSVVTGGASSSDSLYAGLDPSDVSLTNTDDDTAGVVVTPTAGHVTTESGGTSTFTVVLATQPLQPVTINLSTGDGGEVSLSTSTLSFSTSDWSTPKSVTLTGVNDDVDDGDSAFSITLAAAVSADATYSGLGVSDVSGTNVDNDSAAFVVSPMSGLVTTEAGGSDSFTVKLATQPTSSVQVPISVSDASEAQANKSSLTFTVGNWAHEKTVTLTGVNDDVDDTNVSFTVVVGNATSSDDAYDGLDPADVTGLNVDDDTAGITVSNASGLSTSESGTTASFDVVLDSEPTASVTLAVSSDDTGEVAVLSPASGTLSFDAANWDDAQQVTLVGADDELSDGAVDATIGLGPSVSGDGNYSGLSIGSVTATNADDDPLPEIAIDTSASLTEGNSNNKDVTLEVSLDRESTSTVSVTYATANGTAAAGADYTSESATLDFLAGETSKDIEIEVLGDYGDESNETFTVSLSGPSSSGTLGNASAAVTIVDNDETPSVTGATTSSALLSQASTESMMVTCDFTDSDGHGFTTFDVSLSVRDEIDGTTVLCSGASHGDGCSNGAGGLSVTKDGTNYQASVSWDPAPGLADGSYDLSCTVVDRGSNSATVDYDSNTAVFTLDGSAPTAPSVTATSPTSDATPTWSWSSGGGGNATYRYELDDSDLSNGATETTSTSHTPTSNLSDAAHTLYVQERDAAGNWSLSGSKVVTVDTTGPSVQGVSGTNGTYGTGGVVSITVVWNEAVTVSGGTPTLELNTAPARSADYLGGTGTTTLTFEYTVVAGDEATALDYASTGALQLGGASIKDSVGNDATTTLVAPGEAGSLSVSSSIVVNGS